MLDGEGVSMAISGCVGGKHTANSVALDLLREFLQHINFALPSLSSLEALHNLLGPLAAFSTRRALPAALVLVEGREPRYGADDVRALIHDDNSCGAQARLAVLEGVEVHELLVTGGFGQDGRGRAAWDDGFEIIPAAADAAGVFVDELFEGDGHFLFDGAGVVDVSGDAEELGAGVALAAEGVEPVCAAADDGGCYGDGFDIGDGGGAAEEADCCWEGGLQPGFSWLAFQGLD